MDVSVIIVNYNVKHFLKQCLFSVQEALQGISAEIIVIDNASTDGSKEYILPDFPEVIWLQNEDNIGYGAANNQGIAIAKGQFSLLLNPDTVVKHDSITKSVEYLRKNKDAGGLGIKMIDGSGTYLPESKRSFPSPAVAFYKLFGLSSMFPHNKTFGKYHLTYLDKNENHEVSVLSGAFFMAATAILQQIKGFDDDFFMYGEDIDLSYRLEEAGYKNHYFADSTIVHYKGESTKKGSLNYVKNFYEAMIIFAKKHYPAKKRNLFTSIMQVAIWMRAFITVMASFAKAIGLLLFDAILAYLLIHVFKELWLIFKTDVRAYKDSIYLINFPLYVVLGLFTMFFSGGYDRPYRLSKIVRGGIYTIIVISIAYAFLPSLHRFSRAMIVLSSLAITVVMIANRMIIQYFRHGSFSFYRSMKRQFLVVGDEDSLLIKEQLLPESSFYSFLGMVNSTHTNHPEQVGTVSQLPDMIKLLKPTDIIVDTKAVDYTTFVHLVDQVASKRLKIHSTYDGGETIISSHDSNLSGDIYERGYQFKINRTNERRKKRIFDMVVSTFLLIFSPILVWFQKNPGQYLQHAFLVLFGKKTWIGYANGSIEGLPVLKPGVLSTHGLKQNKYHKPEVELQLNKRYAKHYSVYEDWDILLANWNRLGD